MCPASYGKDRWDTVIELCLRLTLTLRGVLLAQPLVGSGQDHRDPARDFEVGDLVGQHSAGRRVAEAHQVLTV